MENNPQSLGSTANEFAFPAIIRRGALDLVLVALFFVFSWVAVSLAYGNRLNTLVWTPITLLAVGMPAYVGVARRGTSELAVWIAVLLALVCPIAYVATGSNEQIRDTIFLSVGCTLLFVSSAWATSFLLTGKRLQALLAGTLGVGSMIAVVAMTSIYMFLV